MGPSDPQIQGIITTLDELYTTLFIKFDCPVSNSYFNGKQRICFLTAFMSCDLKTPNQCLITLLCWKLRLAFLYWIWMCLLCLMTFFFHCCQTTVTKGRLGVRANQSSSRANVCLIFKLNLTSRVLIRSGCLFMAVRPAAYLREGRMWRMCLKRTIKMSI